MNDFKLNNELKIESGFKIPDYYFENFSKKIAQKLTEEEPKVISIFERRKVWIYAAVAIIVISLSIPIINTLNSSSSDLDKTILEDYLTNHATITDDDLVELLDDQDIQKIKIDCKIEDKAIEDILSSNSNLEEYIIN